MRSVFFIGVFSNYSHVKRTPSEDSVEKNCVLFLQQLENELASDGARERDLRLQHNTSANRRGGSSLHQIAKPGF